VRALCAPLSADRLEAVGLSACRCTAWCTVGSSVARAVGRRARVVSLSVWRVDS